MIAKVFIWLWYWLGIPCWVGSFLSIILGWIHMGDVKEFVTLMITVILGLSKVLIIWVEKGDKVKAKIKEFFNSWKSTKKKVS